MPTYQLLTDRTLAQSSAITPTTLIHIVYTGDPSQNIAGSSYKAELGQLAGLFSGASDTLVTGGTYSAGTITFTNNSGSTFSVSGLTEPFTGGTVSGATNFTNGLTANTISATTYQNLPLDIRVTGGTYSAGTATFTNNSGGTFNVTGFTTGDTTTITGATSVGTGVTIFDSVIDRDIKINSITGDTLEKITTTLSSNTIEVGINEQNLDLWSLVVQGNRLISGGASYVSGLTFETSALEYIIGGTIYDIPLPTTLVLNSGDPVFNRIDVIVADVSGNTSVVEGTPSANPEKPDIDEETQVEVTFVSIPANGTTPDIDLLLLYNENAGPPTEWSFGAVGLQPTRISGSSTDQTYSGLTSIRVSGVTGAFTTSFRLTGSTTVDTNQFATLQFAIRNLSANTTSSQIRLGFRTTGNTQNGNYVYMNAAGSSGYVQYSSTNTSSWQLISIPLWRFYLTNTNVQVLDVSFNSPNARYYFDMIQLVEGFASSPPTNAWTTIKGDGSTTIIAPNPNATLTISGGTNIGSFISGTSTVVLNLDNNINLNGVTANTISATTYLNLPLSNFTGGTVSGATNFTNGLTANTISATTYLNLPQFSGGSGNCITDLYTSNIHSCSPLNINPLDEGEVYFGSTSGVTIDVTNSRLGIGTSNPQYPLQVFSGSSQLYYDPTSVGGRLLLSGSTNIPRLDVGISPYLLKPNAGISVGIRAWNDTSYPGYGKVGDGHVYAGSATNGLNLISVQGTGTEDYIRFYAGQEALPANIPDIHIQGTGTTRGYVGIGTDTPSEKLDVSGKTKTINFQMTSGATNGYVLTSDASGNASWQASTGGGGTFTGGTVSGATNFTNGLTANTMSASTLFVNGVQITGDTFVTGGTFLIDTITFTNNQNNTFQVTGITASGTTFTGGSGNCIADLYVTNIHGCSPITIYDSIRSTGSTVSGLTSFSFGFETSATTDYSHAKGYQTLASGVASSAEGFGTIASGNSSHSEGQYTVASGTYSHSEGELTTASGIGSHSEGQNTIASGWWSHAEGGPSSATTFFAHSEGSGTLAQGVSSHAEGVDTTTNALAGGSHAEGWGTIAYEQFQHVSGQFNNTTNANQYFIIGRGTSNAARANALRVSSNGNLNIAGTLTQSSADYAEYFESLNGESIPFGTVVELENDKIKICENPNNAIGVISASPSIVGNAEEGTADEWVGKYEKDEWGRKIMEDYTHDILIGFDENGNKIFRTVTKQRYKFSENFDPNVEYVKRENRPEWNIVGLLGQVRVLKNQQIPSRWIKMKDINEQIGLYLIR
jgi:hypothetical protein